METLTVLGHFYVFSLFSAAELFFTEPMRKKRVIAKKRRAKRCATLWGNEITKFFWSISFTLSLKVARMTNVSLTKEKAQTSQFGNKPN